MLKILQARLQQYMNWELPDIQAGFRKSRGTTDQIAITCWIFEKAREFQKYTYFCFIDHAKAFDCGSQQTVENLQRWEYQTILPAFWEICMQVKKQQLEPDMEQRTGFKLGKQCAPAVYTLLLNLYSEYTMWNARLDKAQAGIKNAGRNINNLRYADDTTFMSESEEELEPLESERGEWKSWLKTQHSES